MLRKAVVAGHFYPKSETQLRAMIETFIDPDAEKEEVVGLVSPHAGYVYSGPVAGTTMSHVIFKDTCIIIGPNHTGKGRPFSVMTAGVWETPLGEVPVDSELANTLVANSSYLRADIEAHKQEHAIEVQLPFLQFFKRDIKIVPIMFTAGSAEIYKEIGHDIARSLTQLNRGAVIIASSDMNHYESQEISQKKDNLAIEAILAMDEDSLARKVEESNITMCGYGPTIAMLAAAKDLGAQGTKLIKYQTSGDISGDYDAVVGYAGIIVKKLSPPVQLAKEAVERYVRDKKSIEPQQLTDEMKGRAGVFVCIKKEGDLRGCIGTFEPTQENIAREIVANAISTATRDPRFEPVKPDELRYLDYSVDILTSPEPVDSQDELDPAKYGIIVESGNRRGLLLPDLEGVNTVEQQIGITRQKAGIGASEPVKLYRFEVKRFK